MLVGPIAAGKSYLGSLLERRFDIPFLRYEDIFVSEYKRNPDGFLKRSEPLAEKAIFDFLLDKRKYVSKIQWLGNTPRIY